VSPDPPDATDPPDGTDEHSQGGGIMRRLGAGTRGAAGAFSVVEQFFAPNAHDARRDLAEQRRIGRPAPAPTDPPDLAPGPGGRFRGRIVIRRPAAASATPPAPPSAAGEPPPDAPPPADS
jgi:hypothetical protein